MTDVVAPSPAPAVAPGVLSATGNPTAALDHLEELEDVVVTGRRVPFSSGVVVNEDHVLGLVERIRTELPETVMAAAETVRDRRRLYEGAAADAEAVIDRANREAEDIIGQAHHDAEAIVTHARTDAATIVADAHAEAERLTAEHTIMLEAGEQARELRESVQLEVTQLRSDADAYTREVMESLAEHLQRVSGAVDKGLRALPEVGARRRR